MCRVISTIAALLLQFYYKRLIVLDGMDVLAYSNVPEHATEALQGLDQYRKECPQYCDFTLVINGTRFPCHRSVLCLYSEYFRGMIGGKFAEERNNQVDIKDADLISMEKILDFIYSGRLKIDQDSVERLLKSAITFQFRKVIDICVNYLRHQIDETNSLDIYNVGRGLAIPDLAEAAKHFTYDRLETVFDVANVVKDMTRQEIEDILQDELARVHGEEQKVMSILKWISFDKSERLKDMERLVETVDWTKLSARFVLRTLFEYPLVNSNTATKKLIIGRVKNALEDVSSSSNLEERQTARRFRNRDRPLGGCTHQCSEEVLLLIGGLTLGEAERDDTSQPNVMCYSPKTNQWQTRSNWPERRLRGFSVSRFYSDVIVSGGCDHVEMKRFNMKRCWKYDTKKDVWVRLKDMTYARSFHSSCEIKGELFVLGGAFNDKIDMEVYSSHSSSWNVIKQHAPRLVKNFTATQCNGKILLMGSGVNSSSMVMQCYNPSVAQWMHFRSPNIPRQLSAPLCCTSPDESCVYLIGDNTQKVFVFDPNANEWSRAEDMNNLHTNGGVTVIGKSVFVTGGHWERDGYSDEMESYDADTKTWTAIGPLPHLWLYHTCTTIMRDACSKQCLCGS